MSVSGGAWLKDFELVAKRFVGEGRAACPLSSSCLSASRIWTRISSPETIELCLRCQTPDFGQLIFDVPDLGQRYPGKPRNRGFPNGTRIAL